MWVMVDPTGTNMKLPFLGILIEGKFNLQMLFSIKKKKQVTTIAMISNS